ASSGLAGSLDMVFSACVEHVVRVGLRNYNVIAGSERLLLHDTPFLLGFCQYTRPSLQCSMAVLLLCPRQFLQMRQQFRMPMDMENEARYIALGSLRHEWLAPEAEQRFRFPARQAVSKDEGNRLGQLTPARLPNFCMA